MNHSFLGALIAVALGLTAYFGLAAWRANEYAPDHTSSISERR
jgi:hypothetical protein